MSPLSLASFIAITGAIVPAVQSEKYFYIFNSCSKKIKRKYLWCSSLLQNMAFLMKITSPFHPIYRMRHLVSWSFPLESVKDEANPICTAEGKEKAEISSEIQFEKVEGAGDGYLFENPILMQQQQDPPRVRMKRFQMDSSCTFAKYQKTWKPSSFQQQHKISGPGTWWVVFCSFQSRTCLDSLCWLIINTFYVHVSAEVECRRKCSQVPQPTFWDNNTSRGTRLVKMLNHNSCTIMTLKRLKGW